MTGGFDTLDNMSTMDDGGHEGKLLAQRYRIINKLGEGGMGMVYLAEDTELGDEKVAIKFIPPMLAGNARAIRNLKKEALTARQLSHPNIVRLHDLHTDGHQKFLVMEYIQGSTLDDMLGQRESESLPVADVVRMVEQLAAGLDYAHSKQVLHRDLKPSNIMVGQDGTVKLLDFGIAREIKDSYTRVTGNLTSGTLPYMSPEQLLGEKPTVVMDVYSLGAVVYECLAGHPPFFMGDIRRQIEVKEPARIEGVSDHVNQALQVVLSKESGQRPRSAGEFVERLKGGAVKVDAAPPPAPVSPQPEASAVPRAPAVKSEATNGPEPTAPRRTGPEAPLRRIDYGWGRVLGHALCLGLVWALLYFGLTWTLWRIGIMSRIIIGLCQGISGGLAVAWVLGRRALGLRMKHNTLIALSSVAVHVLSSLLPVMLAQVIMLGVIWGLLLAFIIRSAGHTVSAKQKLLLISGWLAGLFLGLGIPMGGAADWVLVSAVGLLVWGSLGGFTTLLALRKTGQRPKA